MIKFRPTGCKDSLKGDFSDLLYLETRGEFFRCTHCKTTYYISYLSSAERTPKFLAYNLSTNNEEILKVSFSRKRAGKSNHAFIKIGIKSLTPDEAQIFAYYIGDDHPERHTLEGALEIGPVSV